MKRWWKHCVTEYVFNDAELLLLRHAAEAFDVGEQARQVLRREGLTLLDAKGQTKAHPCTAIARDARASFARAIKQLDLEDS